MSTLNRCMAVLVGLAALAQLLLWYPRLPAVVPSHFNAQGQVDGQMAKPAFFLLFAAIHLVVLPGFFLLGKALSRLPVGMINVPYRDYWLQPPQRERTLARLLNLLLLCGWTTSLLLIGQFQLTSQVAVGRRDSISPIFEILLVVYLVVTILAVVVGVGRFYRRPPVIAEQPADPAA